MHAEVNLLINDKAGLFKFIIWLYSNFVLFLVGVFVERPD